MSCHRMKMCGEHLKILSWSEIIYPKNIGMKDDWHDSWRGAVCNCSWDEFCMIFLYFGNRWQTVLLSRPGYWNNLQLTCQLEKGWEGWQSGLCAIALRISWTQLYTLHNPVQLRVLLLDFAIFPFGTSKGTDTLTFKPANITSTVAGTQVFSNSRQLTIGGTVENYMWKPAPTDFWSESVKC